MSALQEKIRAREIDIKKPNIDTDSIPVRPHIDTGSNILIFPDQTPPAAYAPAIRRDPARGGEEWEMPKYRITEIPDETPKHVPTLFGFHKKADNQGIPDRAISVGPSSASQMLITKLYRIQSRDPARGDDTAETPGKFQVLAHYLNRTQAWIDAQSHTAKDNISNALRGTQRFIRKFFEFKLTSRNALKSENMFPDSMQEKQKLTPYPTDYDPLRLDDGPIPVRTAEEIKKARNKKIYTGDLPPYVNPRAYADIIRTTRSAKTP